MMKDKTKPRQGFSLLEILVALGIFSLLVTLAVSSALGSFSFFSANGQADQAQAMAEEAIQAVKSIGNRDWNELGFNRSAVDDASGVWKLSGEGTTDQSVGFVRTIDFQTVYRDGGGVLVSPDTLGARPDVAAKLVKVNVSWRSDRGLPQTLEREFLVSDRRTVPAIP
jgi:prepilin-type N-terminal cleavage/methylation domain-containing protein